MNHPTTIKEALERSIQFTELGYFPEAVPENKNWVNVMGKVYAFDFTAALQDITRIVEEVIGEDEEVPRPQDEESRDRFYRKSGQNFLRNQIKTNLRKVLE